MTTTGIDLTPTTTKLVGVLADLADRTEATVLNAACVVWSYTLAGCIVDLVISRRGGRIIRAHVLERGPDGRWLHFKGKPSANARAVKNAAGL